MLVRHTMTPNPLTVGPDDRCLDVLRTFRARGFRHAPVVEDGHLVGVVSERDLLRALPALVESFEGEEGRKSLDAPVRSVMHHTVTSCGPSEPVDVVARRMLDARLGCLTVVQDGELVGIVTNVDLLRGFTDHLEDPQAEALTLLWTRGGIGTAPDVARLVQESGARLNAYFVTETTTGALALMVRLTGDAATRGRFRELCIGAGLLLMATHDAA